MYNDKIEKNVKKSPNRYDWDSLFQWRIILFHVFLDKSYHQVGELFHFVVANGGFDMGITDAAVRIPTNGGVT